MPIILLRVIKIMNFDQSIIHNRPKIRQFNGSLDYKLKLVCPNYWHLTCKQYGHEY